MWYEHPNDGVVEPPAWDAGQRRVPHDHLHGDVVDLDSLKVHEIKNILTKQFILLVCTLQQIENQFLWLKHPFYQHVIQADLLHHHGSVHITYLYTTIIWKPVLLYTWHIYMGVVLISCTLKNLFPNQFLNVQKILYEQLDDGLVEPSE